MTDGLTGLRTRRDGLCDAIVAHPSPYREKLRLGREAGVIADRFNASDGPWGG